MRIQVGCMTLSWYETEYKEISSDSSSVKILGRDGEVRVVSFTPDISRKVSSSRKRISKTNETTSCRAIIRGKSNSPNNFPDAVTNS